MELSRYGTDGKSLKGARGWADQLTAVVFTASPWGSACPVLRIHFPAKYAGIRVLAGNDGENTFLDRLSSADLVIVQRDYPRYRQSFRAIVAAARQHGIPMVYESDDLLHELPEEHADHAYYQEAQFPIMQALVEADAVTTSTAPLADHYRVINPNVCVLPNYIDADLWPVHRLPPAGDKDCVVIGYMGTHTHMSDLLSITPALISVLNRNSGTVRLKVWGPRPSPLLLNRTDVDWEALAIVDYCQFAEFFARQSCDIFVAPLCDNDFNRCKSHLKFLEYSVLGVPGVYSRVVPYEDIIVHGHNGLLASGLEEWQLHLNRLIDDPAVRLRMGINAQKTVRGHWLISQHAEQWRDFYYGLSSPTRPIKEATAAGRLIRHLGIQLQRFEAELEKKQLLTRVLIHSLEELQRR
jgi:glycosyltransferase involved in cell wall biosynthesis